MILARRALLKSVVSSLMLTLPLAQIGCGSDEPAPVADTHASTSAVYDAYVPPQNVDAARLIAQRYLALVAPDASITAIRELVQPTIDLATHDPDIELSVSALRTQVKDDFTDGDFLNIDGWHLARTELQLCVLATMPEVAALT